MKKQPKLVLREACIADITRAWRPGRFVEMGAGTGSMTRLFLERGFTGACHDLGADSRRIMRANLADAGACVRVVDDLAELAPASFEYLLAFEVLEHIADDLEVLRAWVRYLKPGGRVLVSVPAHQRKYGKSDEMVGHVRRYERASLRALLAGAGIGHIRIVNYGFPVTEFTRGVSNWMIRNEHGHDDLTPEQRSVRSAQARSARINRALAWIGDGMFTPFVAVQRWFYQRDWGDGYVATGIKQDA